MKLDTFEAVLEKKVSRSFSLRTFFWNFVKPYDKVFWKEM